MAPKTSEQFEEIRRKSRQKIEEVALELFAKQGFHNTSISQIAKAATVSKGLLYNYYNSKKDLLDTIIHNAVDEGEEAIEQFLASDLSPLQKISAITEGSIQMVQADPHHWRLMTALAFQEDIMQNLKEKIQLKKDEMLAQVSKIFSDMGFGDPEKEAYFYGALLDGIMVHYITLGDAYPLEAMKEYILNKYKNISNEKA